MVTDIKNLGNGRNADLCDELQLSWSLIVLGLTMESFLVPGLIFLLSIGIAIVYNMGTNSFLGGYFLSDPGIGGSIAAWGNAGLLHFPAE